MMWSGDVYKRQVVGHSQDDKARSSHAAQMSPQRHRQYRMKVKKHSDGWSLQVKLLIALYRLSWCSGILSPEQLAARQSHSRSDKKVAGLPGRVRQGGNKCFL